MKAVVKTQPGIGLEVMDMPYPTSSSNSVILKIIACGICGADLEVYMGRLSKFAQLPMIMGHEFTGEIIERGDEVKDFSVGDKVVVQPFTGMCGKCYYCKTGQAWACSSRRMIGGMAEYVAVPSENLYPIPDTLDAFDAALCEPFAVALHALHVSSFKIMDTAVVLGPGPIGLMTTMALKNSGASFIMTTGTQDDVPLRLDSASKMADVTVNISEADPVELVKQITNGLGVDVVFDTTGSPQAAPQGLQMLKTKGKLIIIGHYPGTIPLPDPSYKGYSIIGNVSYDWDTWERMIPYLARRPVDFKQFISHQLPLPEAIRGFELARSRKGIKVLFQP